MTTLLSRITGFARLISTWARAHKGVALVIAVIVIAGGYGGWHMIAKGADETRYVLAVAEKGTVMTTITGSGQVSASNTVTIAAKSSGELVSMNAVVGQTVKAGALIASVDPSDAAYDLESARISYDRQVSSSANELSDATNDLSSAYADGRATLTKAATDLTGILQTLASLLGKDGYLTATDYSRSTTAGAYRQAAAESYDRANDAFREFSKAYALIGASSTSAELSSALASAYDSAGLVVQASKDALVAVAYNRDHDDRKSPDADDVYATASSEASAAASVFSSLGSTRQSITAKERALADVTSSSGPLDLRSAELSLRQKQEAYDDRFLRAPFDGIIASADAKQGDQVGSGTKIATLITPRKIAELSLNEVDAAKVAVGQKATLTFDAVDGLTLAGTVSEVDLVGSVSQGVVTYAVKIAFDIDDDRVKPGMTVDAAIVTEVRTDVLQVPSTAIRSRGGSSYVQVLSGVPAEGSALTTGVTSAAAPREVEVVTGLSGDETTEITSGLSEGDAVVARVTTAATPSRTTSASTRTTGNNAFGGGAAGRAGGFGATFRTP